MAYELTTRMYTIIKLHSIRRYSTPASCLFALNRCVIRYFIILAGNVLNLGW